MVNRMRTIYYSESNKGFGSKFHVCFQLRQETPEEGRRTYRLKCCEFNNRNVNNSLNTVDNEIIVFHQKKVDQQNVIVSQQSNKYLFMSADFKLTTIKKKKYCPISILLMGCLRPKQSTQPCQVGSASL